MGQEKTVFDRLVEERELRNSVLNQPTQAISRIAEARRDSENRMRQNLDALMVRLDDNQSVLSAFDSDVETNWEAILSGGGVNADWLRDIVSQASSGFGGIYSGISNIQSILKEYVETNSREDSESLYNSMPAPLKGMVSDIFDWMDPESTALASEYLSEAGERIGDYQHVVSTDAKQLSQFYGDFTDPSSWSLDPRASASGVIRNVLGGIGYMAPQFIGGIANVGLKGAMVIGGVTGGLQAADGAKNEVSDYFHELNLSGVDFYNNFSYAKDLVDNHGMSYEEAKDATIKHAENLAFTAAGGYGIASGALLQGLLGRAGTSILDSIPGVSRNLLTRASTIVAGTSAFEGVQEFGETVVTRAASNFASGDNRNLTEDTFNDFAYGALVGKALSTVPSVKASHLESRRLRDSDRYGSKFGAYLADRNSDIVGLVDIRSDNYNATELAQEISAMPENDNDTPLKEAQIDKFITTVSEGSRAWVRHMEAYDANLLLQNKQKVDKWLAARDALPDKGKDGSKYDGVLEIYQKGIAAVEAGKAESTYNKAKSRLAEIDTAVAQLEEILPNLGKKKKEETSTEGTSQAEVDINTDTDGSRVYNQIARSPQNYSSGEIYSAMRRLEGTIPQEELDLMRAIAETNESAESVKGLAGVRRSILNGSAEWRGVNTYRQRISDSLASSNLETAAKHFGELLAFFNVHSGKSNAMAQAIQSFHDTGIPQVLAPAGNGVYINLTGQVTPKEGKDKGYLTIDAGSQNFINLVSSEVILLDAAVNEASRAIALAHRDTQEQQAQNELIEDDIGEVESTTVPTSEGTQEAQIEPTQDASEEVTSTSTEAVQQKASVDNTVTNDVGDNTPTPTEPTAIEDAVQATVEGTQDSQTEASDAEGEALTNSQNPDLSVQEENFEPNIDTDPDITEAQIQEEAARAYEDIPSEAESFVSTLDHNEVDSLRSELIEKQDSDLLTDSENEILSAIDSRLAQEKDGTTATAYSVLDATNKATMPETVDASNHTEINQITKFYNISNRKVALNSKANFLNDTTREDVEELIGRELTNTEAELLPVLLRGLRELNSSVSDTVGPEKSDPKYRYKEPLNYFRDSSGNLDPNVLTAISSAIFNAMYELANVPEHTTMKDAERMIGDKAKDMRIYNMINQYHVTENTLIQTLGNEAFRALGIKATPDIFGNIEPKLITSLGMAAVGTMSRLGYIQVDSLEINDIPNVRARELYLEDNPGKTPKDALIAIPKLTSKTILVKVKRQNGQAHSDVLSVRDSFRGHMNMATELFRGEAYTREAIFLPEGKDPKTLFNQENTSKDTLVSDKIREAEEYKATIEWEPYTEFIESVWEHLDDDIKMMVMGFDPDEHAYTHPNQINATRSKRDTGRRDIQAAEDLVYDPRAVSGQPFHFVGDVWINQRSGYQATSNPQTNKVMSALVRARGWEAEIDTTNPEQRRLLNLAMAQGLGIKIDNLTPDQILDKVEELINTDVLLARVTAAISDGKLNEHQDEFLALVKRYGEKDLSMDAIFNMSKLLHSSENKIRVKLVVEADGKTNGPILALMSLGVVSGEASGVSYADAGGFFTDPNIKDYGDYKQGNLNPDTYEALATVVANRLANINLLPIHQATLDAVYRYTGNLYVPQEIDPDNPSDVAYSVTSAGRNMVKTPITAFIFGSGPKGAVESAFYEDVLPAIYSKIKEIVDNRDPDNNEAYVAALTAEYTHITRLMGGYRLPIDPIKLPEYRFSNGDIEIMKNNFMDTLGNEIVESINSEFSEYIKTRNSVNTIANAATRIYTLAFESERRKLLRELVASGAIPATSKGTPLYDLTREQIKTIETKLAPIFPAVATHQSDANTDHMSGVSLLKSSRAEPEGANASMYTARLDVNGRPQVRVADTFGMEPDAGVRGIINPTHATDSGISMSVDRLEIPTLNNHDAKLTGLDSLSKVVEELNESTFRSLAENDLITETLELADRVIDYYLDNQSELAALGLSPRTIAAAFGSDNIFKLIAAQQSKFSLFKDVVRVGQYPFPGMLKDLPVEAKAAYMDALRANLTRSRAIAQRLSTKLSNSPKVRPTKEQIREINNLMNIINNDRSLTTEEKTDIRYAAQSGLTTVFGIVNYLRKDNPNLAKKLQKYVESPSAYEVVGTGFIRALGYSQRRALSANASINRAFKSSGDILHGKDLGRALLKGINRKTTEGQMQYALAKVLIPLLGNNIAIKINRSDSDVKSGPLGTTEVSPNGEVFVVLNHYNDGFSGVNSMTILHEMIHVATEKQLFMVSSKNKKATPEMKKAHAALVNMMESVKEHEFMKRAMASDPMLSEAMLNVDEFLAWSLTYPPLQNVLKSIPRVGETSTSPKRNFFRELISNIAKLLGIRQESMLAEVIETGSVLMEEYGKAHSEAANRNSKKQKRRKHNMVATVDHMSSLEIFDELAGPTNSEHNDHLKTLLEDMVNKSYTFYEVNQAGRTYSQTDIDLLRATGTLQDTGSVFSPAYGKTDVERFVSEQIYQTMLGMSRENYVPLRQMRQLMLEAKKHLSPEDFTGDISWSELSAEERQNATDKYNQLFGIGANPDLDILGNFAAIALTSEEAIGAIEKLPVNNKLRDRIVGNRTVKEKLQSLFAWALDALFGSLIKGGELKTGNDLLKNIAVRMGQNEVKFRKRVGQNSESNLASVSNVIDSGITSVRGAVSGALGNLDTPSSVVNVAGKLSSLAMEGKLEDFLREVQRFSALAHEGQEGFIGGLINELVGTSDLNEAHHVLFNRTKGLEVQRRQINEAVQTLLNNAYHDGGKDLTPEHREAIYRGLLKTNLSALLDPESSNLDFVINMATNTDARRAEIDKLKQELIDVTGNPDVSDIYLYRAASLGMYLATGLSVGRNMALSSKAIAQGIGVKTVTPDPAIVNRAETIIEKLVTLSAVDNLPTELKRNLADAINSDSRNNHNGIHTTLKYHNHTKALSKKALFSEGNEEVNMVDGYTTTNYSENNSLRVAYGESEIKSLKKMGYEVVSELATDSIDPYVKNRGLKEGTKPTLMTIPDGGPVSRITGSISTTGRSTMGSDVGLTRAQANSVSARVEREMLIDIRSGRVSLTNTPVDNRFAVPNFDGEGNVISYRYVMADRVKDNLLNREVDFAQVLGNTHSNIFDKTTSKPHNVVIVSAIKATWDTDKADNPHAFIRIGVNSEKVEHKELWALLPEHTKREARSQFGGDFLMVRRDLLNLHFGYRKKSLSAPFDEAFTHMMYSRKEAWDGLGDTTKKLFTNPSSINSASDFGKAMYVDLGIAIFGDKVGLRMKQGQDFWESVVDEVKDIRVIKNFVTLASNISSNMTVLLLYGAGIGEAVRKHREGALAAIEWENLTSERIQLENAIEAGITPNTAAIQNRLREIEQTLNRSPMKAIVDAGLYQSIVSEIDVNQKENQHFTKIKDFVKPATDLVPDKVKTVGRYVFVTKDTGLYKFMYRTTQMSDLVSRYALYHHLMERTSDRLSHQQAITEARDAFVNYDLPSNEWVQFANDMGGVMFTKYYLRIAKVMARLTGQHPSRMLAGLMFSEYVDGVGVLTDSYLWNKMPNLFNNGAFEMTNAFTEPFPIAAAMSLLD